MHHTPTPKITPAYLLGALHDSTERTYTFRICQKSFDYIQIVAEGIKALGFKSWTYNEGKNRGLYVVEFSKKLLTKVSLETFDELSDYIRGYFDTEGGIPRSLSARYYIYFAQKNFDDIVQLRNFLLKLNFSCGEIHNPSKKVDPNYFRFYVLRKSWERFGAEIGSLHPVKAKYLRMKI